LSELAEESGPPESPADSGRILGRLVKKAASTSFLLQVSGMLISTGSQVFLARVLGVNAFGVYTYATNVGSLGGPIARMGLPNSALRFVPQYRANAEWSLLRGVLKSFRLIPVVVGSALALIAGIVLWNTAEADQVRPAILISLLLTPLISFVSVQQSIVRGFQRIFAAYFPPNVLQPALLIGGVGLASIVGVSVSAPAASIAGVATWLVIAAILAIVLGRTVPSEHRHGPRHYDVKAWRGVVGNQLYLDVIYVVFARLDVVLVGVLVGTRDVGLYSVAIKAGVVAGIIQTAMNSTVAPLISEYYWSGRGSDVERLVQNAVRLAFLPTLAITAGLAIFATPILELFGGAFARGRTVLVLIAIGQLVSVASGPVGWLMNMTGNQRALSAVFTATALLTVVGYVVLIPWLGIEGAAIANAGAVAVRNIALNELVRRRLGFRVSVIASLRRVRDSS
jgi:O-antigen/teichoic acid export membrane protein